MEIEFEVDDEQLALLQLNLTPGIGPRLQSLLLNRFGSAMQIFAASGSELLAIDGIGAKLSAELTRGRDLAGARRELERSAALGIELLWSGDSGYPVNLSKIHDPPPVLYAKGRPAPEDALAVAIVGSRRCTHYGRQQAEKFASALARAGVTIVSGLARGIDAAAHRGALSAGGRTLAVCAPGLAHLYPPEHRELADEVIASGALLSESPVDRGAQPGLFPQRNRIIAGLSLGVLIVEAGRKSGALHTARHANEQGRDVFALPGRVDSLASEGCHNLIRDGAILVQSADDILDALGPMTRPVATSQGETIHSPRELNLNEVEREILNLIDTAPTEIDRVLAQTNLAASQVLSTLTVLEMKKLVRRLPGSFVERTGC